jgi:hypothetical protein
MRELVQRLLRQVLAEFLERLVARVNLVPVNLLLSAVHLLDHALEHGARRPPDVGAGAVAFDVRNDRIVRNDDAVVLVADAGAGGRVRDAVGHGARTLAKKSQSLKVSESQREMRRAAGL